MKVHSFTHLRRDVVSWQPVGDSGFPTEARNYSSTCLSLSPQLTFQALAQMPKLCIFFLLKNEDLVNLKSRPHLSCYLGTFLPYKTSWCLFIHSTNDCMEHTGPCRRHRGSKMKLYPCPGGAYIQFIQLKGSKLTSYSIISSNCILEN